MKTLRRLGVCPGVASATLGAQTGDPVALAAKVQQRYNGIKDFQGDFVQTYEGGVLRTKTTERGTVAIKRPGPHALRLHQAGKERVRLGRQSPLHHLVADKQVIVSPAPGPDQGDIPAMFLAGQSDLARDYTPTLHAIARRCTRPGHAEARAQEAERRIRVARHRRRPENPPDPVPDGRRHAGRPIVVLLQLT